MLGLKIRNVTIKAITNGGTFSTNIPFEDGLNVVRAENSSGKSTVINSIAYGLGLESILGPSRKRPFPKSLYEVIFDNKKDDKPFIVSSSFVELTIENSHNIEAVIRRDISGNDKKVAVSTDEVSTDFFLGNSGFIGSANSERGYHNWLAKFLGWALPDVVTYDGKECKLYLECIFPLFFIEQKRGWSEIQANAPTQYGIKNLKRRAVEFCLDINSFDYESKLSKLKLNIEDLENTWKEIKAAIESVADYNLVHVENLGLIESLKSTHQVKFLFKENNTLINVKDKRISLERILKQLEEAIENNTPNNEKVDTQLSLVNQLSRGIQEQTSSLELKLISIKELEEKLAQLNLDYRQYRELKRLKDVGSVMDEVIGSKTCPVCESDFYDDLGKRSTSTNPMTLEENIDFLKSQIDFFMTMKESSLSDYKEANRFLQISRKQLESERDALNQMRKESTTIDGHLKGLLREKIQAEVDYKNALKIEASQADFNQRATHIYNSWLRDKESLRLLKGNAHETDKSSKIKALQGLVQANLQAFKFKPGAIQSVSISENTFRPEQEGYDIVAETSASDYIRIIWSYTLALMENAAGKTSCRHGGFVVFDEPRQHEANMLSFANLVDKASQSSTYNGQVIFATSLDLSELNDVCVDKEVNIQSYDEYVLTLENDSE